MRLGVQPAIAAIVDDDADAHRLADRGDMRAQSLLRAFDQIGRQQQTSRRRRAARLPAHIGSPCACRSPRAGNHRNAPVQVSTADAGPVRDIHPRSARRIRRCRPRRTEPRPGSGSSHSQPPGRGLWHRTRRRLIEIGERKGQQAARDRAFSAAGLMASGITCPRPEWPIAHVVCPPDPGNKAAQHCR